MEIKLQNLITWTVVLDTVKGDSHLFLRYPTVQQQFQMQDELGQKVRFRFSLFKAVAYSTAMRKSILSLSRPFIFTSVNLLQNSFRRRNRNLFTLQSSQKAGVQGSPHTERTEVENYCGYLTF